MSKSYEERMAEKYNFLKKDNDKAPENSEKIYKIIQIYQKMRLIMKRVYLFL